MTGWRRASALLPALALTACAGPQEGLLPRFEAALAAQDSATAALEGWCAARGYADPAKVSAEPAPGAPKLPSGTIRALLGVSAGEAVGYRHVRLTCGGRVLSDAHNWYVPSRLSDEMNRTLETGDTPFGKVIAPLGFTRERLAGERGAAEGCPEGTVLSHRAVLRLPDGRPISAVIECYTSENLR